MRREKRFSIGQFAKLHGINKKTLMWYDEIGLLKPAEVRENGYRYYTYRQSELLETIRMLRELDMSLPEIESFLKQRSAEAFIPLLQGKLVEVDRRIDRLKEIRFRLAEQEKAYTTLLETDLSGISLTQKQEEYLYVVETGDNATEEEEIEKMMEAVKRRGLESFHATVYGALLPVSSLYRQAFDSYAGLFFQLPEKDGKRGGKGVHVKPAGEYLTAYCRGEWDTLPGRYREILEYAAGRRLRLTGYAYETGINEMVISSMQDYITKIEIPVREEG